MYNNTIFQPVSAENESTFGISPLIIFGIAAIIAYFVISKKGTPVTRAKRLVGFGGELKNALFTD